MRSVKWVTTHLSSDTPFRRVVGLLELEIGHVVPFKAG